MPRPVRDSAKKTKVYTDDPFAAEEIKEAIYASSDSGSSTTEPPDDSGSEPEIPPPEEEEDDDDEELMEMDEGVSDEDLLRETASVSVEDDGESVIGVDEFDDEVDEDGEPIEDGTGGGTGGTRFLRGKGEPVHSMGISKRRIRGIDDWDLKGGKELRLLFLFGPSTEDLMPVIKTRDQWEGHPVLPVKGEEGLHRTFYVDSQVLEKEEASVREWYWRKGGRQAFAAGQKSRPISETDGRMYLPQGPERHVLLGPYVNQQIYSLKTGNFISTATPWENKQDRNGWMFNLGAKVLETQWVPNADGKTQYLAVAVEQTKYPGRPKKPLSEPRPPGFVKHKGFPASIQIWAFDSNENGEVDQNSPPRLELVICAQWGGVKQFKMSPVPLADTLQSKNGESMVHLGLLAGVWMDGKVRVLDISFPETDPESHKPHYQYYSQAAFEVSPPDCIPTCLTWLSAFSIAVGTSNGVVAIWSLNRPGTFPPLHAQADDSEILGTAPAHAPRPWFYKMLSYSYILTICSSYPSRPHFLSTTSVDGFSRLVDLRSPNLDAVVPARNRIFGATQAWHEHTQSFMTPDENYMLRNHTIRRYYMNMHSFSIESQILCCSTSMVHPHVLVGGADGMVHSGNPIGRILDVKEIPWQQVWFHHEWRPAQKDAATTDEAAEDEDADAEGELEDDDEMEVTETNECASPTVQEPQGTYIDNSSIPAISHTQILHPTPKTPALLSGELTRITEGFKPTGVSLQRTMKGPAGPQLATIFEELSAVTAVAWNPNIKFGTWAAAGMGDGLLRVEDIGV